MNSEQFLFQVKSSTLGKYHIKCENMIIRDKYWHLGNTLNENRIIHNKKRHLGNILVENRALVSRQLNNNFSGRYWISKKKWQLFLVKLPSYYIDLRFLERKEYFKIVNY